MVRVNLARAYQRQEKHYNLRRREWRPQLGEKVWKKNYTLSKKSDAINAKLAPRYIGPLEVRRIISPVIMDLRSAHGKWYRHIHVQDLKPAPTNNNNKRHNTNYENNAEDETDNNTEDTDENKIDEDNTSEDE